MTDDRTEARDARNAATSAIVLDLEYLLRLADFEVRARDQDLADRYVRMLRSGLTTFRAAHGAMVEETRRPRIEADRMTVPQQTVYIVCEIGHEDSGTVQAIKGVYADKVDAENVAVRLGEYGHFVDEWPVTEE